MVGLQCWVVSSVQWHDSLSCVCVCVCVCVCIPSHILFHYSLLQDSVYDSVRQCICKLDEPCQTVVHEIMVPLAAL